MMRVAVPRIFAVAMLLAAIAGCSKEPPPGEAQLGRGQYDAAIQTFESRLNSETEVDADARARIATLKAYAVAMQGEAAAADALFAEAKQYATTPEAQARLQLYQGLALSEQSRWQEAAAHLASAESAFRELGMGRSLEFGLSLAGQGVLRALANDGAGGERVLTQALPILRRYRDDYPVFYAEAASNLATLLVMRNDFAGAQPHYENALKSLRDAKSERSDELGHTLNGLAYTQYQSGDYGAAESNLRKAIDAFTRADGESTGDVAKCYHDLAKVYEFADQPEKAEAAFDKAIALYSASLGPHHAYTQQARQSAAEFLRGLGREEDAAAIEGVDEEIPVESAQVGESE